MATLSDLYAHLKTLCEQWFYNKSTTDTMLSAKLNVSDVDSSLSSSSSNPVQNKVINTALSGKASSSHSHGNITNAGAVGSTANKPLITTTNGVVTTGSFGTSANTFCQGNDSRLSDARTPTAHNQASSTITEANALSNIGTSSGATQSAINSAIDTKIGTLAQIDAVQVVTTLPTASATTMGGLYIINENSKVNVYYTEEDSGSYSWHKMDTDILDELSIDWSDITNKPSSFTPSSHTHGYIENDGTISNSTVASFRATNYPLVRDSYDDGKIKLGLIPTAMIRDGVIHSNIGSSILDTQYTINGLIDTALGTINTSLSGKASSTHTHNNITNDGKVTVSGSNGGNLVVTNSSNEVIVESSIDVLDGVVQSLITYGSS